MTQVQTIPYVARQMPKARFKGIPAAVALSPISKMFLFFETQYEPGFILVSKIIGNATPRIAIVRTKEEFGDKLFSEAIQTAAFFLVLPVASALLNPIQGKFANIDTGLIKMRTEEAIKKMASKAGELAANRLKVAKLGKSLGVLSFIFWFKIAMPYVRNWRTAKVTGLADFSKIVALGGKRKPTSEDTEKAQRAIRKNRNITLALTAAGVVTAAIVMAIAGAICRGNAKIFAKDGFLNPKKLEWLMSRFSLVGKNSDQVMSLTKSRLQTLWFWGVPSYIGWFMGCRDHYEVVEQLSNFGTFIVGYMYMTPFMDWLMKRSKKTRDLLEHVKQVTGKPQLPFYQDVIENNVLKTKDLTQRYLTYLNTNKGGALLANLLVIGALPLIFNIYLTRWRYNRQQAALKSSKPEPVGPLPQTPFSLPTIADSAGRFMPATAGLNRLRTATSGTPYPMPFPFLNTTFRYTQPMQTWPIPIPFLNAPFSNPSPMAPLQYRY